MVYKPINYSHMCMYPPRNPMKSPFLLVYKAIKYSHIYIFCIQKNAASPILLPSPS